ncbi:MAG TPA: Si-specific NAD(P)(+) transhydrogenase [Polyangiaceae bacterium]|nr:Si-specific NAD(P)(+) transhydrogenase [Polyangiaceae bacterium]
MPYDYDLVVIGSGPAGEKGAARAAYFGKRVAVIEKEREPGGAAVHTGTLPSKTLRETALFLSGHRQRALYGLHVSLDAHLAVPKLLSRKDAVRKKEVDRITWNLERHGVDLLKGRARFVDAHTVEITGEGGARRVSGEHLLIATGSVPYHPPNIPFDDSHIDDSDTILLLDSMPARMAVLGGGVIGCEYASMFAALGVKITLIEPKGELLSFLDAEVSELLRKALIDLGADVRLNTSAVEVKRRDEGISVLLSTGEELLLDRLLIAAGRSGCTAGLGLEEIGVKVGKRGCVEVDKDFRTSVPSIFAVGDVVGFPALASTSMEQARAAVSSAFGLEYRCEASQLLPYGVYTIPEVSCVGLSEEDAKGRGTEVVVGRGLYKHNARGEICGDTRGMVKLVFERSTRRLLGAHCVGDSATELVHVGQAMIELKGTVDTLIAMVFNYPTLSEAYKYAAFDALGRWDKEPGAGEAGEATEGGGGGS